MTEKTIIERLKSKLEELLSLERVLAHLDEINDSIAKKQQDLARITQQLAKEQKDVEKLEGGGLKPMFYKILGDKEKQLEIERQEYLAVSLKFNALNEEIQLLEYEKDILHKKSLSYEKTNQEVEQLKMTRATEIMHSGSKSLQKAYSSLMDQYDYSVALAKEIEEAFNAANKALHNLEKVIQLLNQAQNWGQWGPRSRQSNYGSMMKRNKLNETARGLAITQRSLDYFAKEMADLGERNMRFHLNIDELSKFTNFFFDNLITDWIIQQKIRNTLSAVASVHDRISRISPSLKSELQKSKLDQERILSEKDQLLISE